MNRDPSRAELALMTLALDLHERLERADEDPDAVLGDQVPRLLSAARALAEAVAPEAAAHVLEIEGLIRLRRYEKLPVGSGAEDREEALRIFRQLAQSDRSPENLSTIEFLERGRELDSGRLGESLVEIAIESTDLRVIDKAISELRRSVSQAPLQDEPRRSHLQSLCLILGRRAELVGDLADARAAVAYGRLAVEEASSPEIVADCLADLAIACGKAHALSGDVDDLHEAVRAMRAAMGYLEEDADRRLGRALNYSQILIVLDEATGDRGALTEAGALLGDLRAGLTSDHERWLLVSDRFVHVIMLGAETTSPDDLDKAIEVVHEVLGELPPGHPDLADWNARLAILLVARIGERGGTDDVVACVQAARTAYGAWDPSAPQRQQFRQVLDRAEQYELRRSLGLPLNEDLSPDDLDARGLRILPEAIEAVDEDPRRAVRLAESAVARASDREARRVAIRSLVDARRRLYQLTGSEADLLAWIATIKRLEKEAKGDRSASAAASYERAVAHYVLFTDLHDQRALNAAIICANSAVFKVPENKEYRVLAVRLLTARYSEKLRKHDLKVGLRLAEPIMDLPDVQRDLGVLLLGRYTEHSDRADLERAAAAFAAAVRSQESPIERARLQLLLARAFFLEFLLTADASTLDAAIAALAEALAELPDGDLKTEILLEESKLRCDRFQHTGQLADVERAEAAAREALSRSPQGDRWHTMTVIRLGEALVLTAEANPDAVDAVTEIIRIFNATPWSADLTARLERVELSARAMRLQFHHTRSLTVLGEAIEAGLATIRSTAKKNTVDYVRRCVLVADLYLDAFKLRGEQDYLDQAKWTLERAVSLSRKAGQPDPAALDRLGLVYEMEAHLSPDYRALVRAARFRRDVALSDSVPPAVRIEAARAWGSLTEPQEALIAYTLAVELLPLLVWRRSADPRNRQRTLADHSGLAREAAACALAVGDPGRAVELLEHGRAVMWSQRLNLHTDLTSLWGAAPKLAARMSELQMGLAPGLSSARVDTGVDRRQVLIREWEQILQQIRMTPRFAKFLSPPAIDDILDDLASEPVVIINIASRRCDALIVRNSGVQVVELDHLSAAKVEAVAERHLQAVLAYENSEGRLRDRAELELALAETNTWLWDNVVGHILTVIGHAAPVADGASWPRVWWCPTGPMALLPLHAAGHHTARDGRTALDRVISSYTPTLRAMEEGTARVSDDDGGDRDKLLIVTLSDAPGGPRLPHVLNERDNLSALMGLEGCVVLEGAAASRSAIRASVAAHPWVHFSCHGTQDLDDPSQNGLILHDGRLTVAELYDSGQQPGELMFLSACKTAAPGTRHLDEAITLASAMRYTGWRHVIGTLWSVWDTTAAEISTATYRCLTSTGHLGTSRTAEALHHAMRAVRDAQPARPSSWSPYVHVGPI